MFELPNLIPDLNDLLGLEPEELGAKLLFLMRERAHDRLNPFNSGGMFSCANLQTEPFSDHPYGNYRKYHEGARSMFNLAFAEAWSWLEAQGLLVPASGMNGTNGFRVLSRRAHKFEDPADMARFSSARLLSKDILHPSISKAVWAAFMRGEFDVAVFQATKAIEVAVRAKTNIDETGVKLMRKAFDKNGGPLTDMTAEEGERDAMAHLFAGAIGVFKNPHSHRDVNVDDPAEAIETIMFANRLLKIVDTRNPRSAND